MPIPKLWKAIFYHPKAAFIHMFRPLRPASFIDIFYLLGIYLFLNVLTEKEAQNKISNLIAENMKFSTQYSMNTHTFKIYLILAKNI